MAQGFAYDNETIQLAGNDAVNVYGSVTGVPATEIVVATYTAAVAGLLKAVYGEGGTDGLFKLYLNSAAIWEGRNAWTQRIITAPVEQSLAIGDIVELKVTNQKNTNHVFTGGFYVYEL